MAARFGITLPLWDALACPDWLETTAGEVGLDQVVVPAVTGPVTTLRLCGPGPLSGAPEPVFASDGGWHFAPEAKSYAAAGVRPTKARWLPASDPLARFREQLERLGLALVARVDLGRVRALADQQAVLLRRNAWGQALGEAGLCVSNPAVRELLRCTLEDLRRYAPTAVEVAGWDVDEPALPHLATCYGPGPAQLLETCFCAACRQIAERAGLDVDAAARACRVTAEQHLAVRAGGGEEAESDPLLLEYRRVRSDDAVEFFGRLAAGETERTASRVLSRGAEEDGDLPSGDTLVRVASYPAASEPDEQELAWCAAAGGWLIEPWRGGRGSGPALVRLVAAGVERGVRVFEFEGLTGSPAEAVTWAKQAVRYAKRAT